MMVNITVMIVDDQSITIIFIVCFSLAKVANALTQVDCTVEQNLCHQLGVSGYPTIRMYPRGSKGDDDI